MSTIPPPQETITITTTIALIEQFLSNLSPSASHHGTPSTAETPSPLLLLNASAKTLKAQVTKLSLLTVTAPFTATAVATCLKPINDSILPSLVTATLLSTPEVFTPSFSSECHSITRTVLRELLTLAKLVESRSNDRQPDRELSEPKKKEITEATGRVWEICDEITTFSDGGLTGFVVRKAKQWLELMKDAVKELTEWDPEEEVDEDDIFGDAQSDGEGPNDPDESEDQGASDRPTISAGVKDQALKVLSRIPQSVHVVIKQRLEKLKPTLNGDLSSTTRWVLDKQLVRIRNISELIDESAEGMYMGNLELCLKKAGEARAETIEVVQSVLQPFEEIAHHSLEEESREDKYVQRALEWIRQVDPTPPGG